jgi:endo-1,4-beta-mannosidase
MPRALCIAGAPDFLLGVNYWSRAGGPRMWDADRFDPRQVQQELAQMRRIGLNCCRSFAFIPSFMPAPPTVEAGALRRLETFLELCQAEAVAAIPSFLVGHMSGENYDFPGQAGRCAYTDPEVLSWELALVRAVSAVAATQPAVAAYLASNEMPRWGGRSTPRTIVDWATTLRRTLHEVDDQRPFSLGDGVMNLDGGQDGFDPGLLTGAVDFVGPHSYYSDHDPLRQALNAEYCLRSLSHLGLPVLFEEFGCSCTQASEANQALYYREVLHACLGVGAAGALGWCYTDFDLLTEPPYEHHAFELGFGVTRVDGSEKLVCDELRSVARLVRDELDWPTLRPPKPVAAIVVPSYFNTTYPFSWEDRARMRRTLLQAYVLCVAAGIEAELVPETKPLERYELLLAPSTQKLLTTTWQRLLRRAGEGATVYWSFFGGDHDFHQGAWCHPFEELVGCRHGLRYGCPDLPDPQWSMDGPGLTLQLATDVGAPFPRAYLPIEPVGAEVLGRDNRGRPALARARHSAGQVIFLNHPLEYYLAEQADVTAASGASLLYRYLAEVAGVAPQIRAHDPQVQIRQAADSRGPLLWLINHGWEEVAARLDTPGGAAVYGTNLALPEGQVTVALAPKQVSLYRLAE